MHSIKLFCTAITALIMLVSTSVASAQTSWFGGEVHNGSPALEVTAALVKSGGGASNFNFGTALVSMLGEETVNAEVEKLNRQYGKEDVNAFINGMTFAVKSALKHATEAGIKLPDVPANLKGVELMKALVVAGTAPDGTWWSGYFFDKALSNQIHILVMKDIDVKFGHAADMTTHKILNQAMYDIAQALGYQDVKLASLH